MSDTQIHALAPARARSGEDPFVGFLRDARKAPVTVSAQAVARLDSHRLQLLLVARRQWQADGVSFRVIDMSPAFREGLQRLGLAATHFDEESVQ